MAKIVPLFDTLDTLLREQLDRQISVGADA
jgi:hypothetical protein